MRSVDNDFMLRLLLSDRLSPVSGQIIIDGVDTSELSNEFLRQNISVIPQDPVLFR